MRIDAGEAGADTELTTWLAERDENERALERVELAVVLGKRLAADPDSALYAEAARAAGTGPRRRTAWRGLAWGGALAAMLLVVVLLVPDAVSPPGEPAPTALRAAELVAVSAPNNPVTVLATGVVVDASAVAVLPFVSSGDSTLATGLERDVVASLRTVPGLYVIADNAAQPYAATELDAAEIGGLLGARGIVDAAVDLADGRVRVSARLRDAATGATLWRADVDRPVDELRAIRYEIAESVAATMLDSSLREQVVRADRSSAPFAASKPFQQ